ncbi:MAG: extracellular solute-binding protein [Clostridia bacterium]|nr:extracellular solute-binding protein [Clostridia bacterium]
MKSAKLFTLLLAALLTAQTVSCGGGSPAGTPSTGDSAPADTTAAENTPAILSQGLNFGGETVTFLYRTVNVSEFYVEEATGDIVDDALFASRQKVEEGLNVKFEILSRIGTSPTDRTEYLNHVAQTVMSGDNAYDWVDAMAANFHTLIQQGVLADLGENKYIDFSAPWWNGGLAEETTLGGGLYYLVGDFSLGYLKDTFCIYYNKDVAAACGITNLNEIVQSGGWTVDKMIELSKKAAADVNGDGKYEYEDKLGFVVHDLFHLCGFIASTDTKMFAKTGDEWAYSFGSERDFAVVEKLNKLLVGTEGNFLFKGWRTSTDYIEDYNRLTAKFIAGDVLFMTAQMNDAVTDLRDMKSDYGILPFPKHDDKQASYAATSRTTHSAVGMPITCENYDMAGAVIEAIAAVNHDLVIPTYYELALKVKYSRDDESAAVYDLILDNTTLAFGYLYQGTVALSPVEIFNAGVQDPTTFSSKLAANKEANETKFAAFMDKVIENNKR